MAQLSLSRLQRIRAESVTSQFSAAMDVALCHIIKADLQKGRMLMATIEDVKSVLNPGINLIHIGPDVWGDSLLELCLEVERANRSGVDTVLIIEDEDGSRLGASDRNDFRDTLREGFEAGVAIWLYESLEQAYEVAPSELRASVQ